MVFNNSNIFDDDYISCSESSMRFAGFDSE